MTNKEYTLEELLQEAKDLEDETLPPVRATRIYQPHQVKNHSINLRISENMNNRLKKISALTGESVSDLIRAALYDHLDAPDLHAENPQTLQKIHDNGSKIIATSWCVPKLDSAQNEPRRMSPTTTQNLKKNMGKITSSKLIDT